MFLLSQLGSQDQLVCSGVWKCILDSLIEAVLVHSLVYSEFVYVDCKENCCVLHKHGIFVSNLQFDFRNVLKPSDDLS